jgi:hypothetical protein
MVIQTAVGPGRLRPSRVNLHLEVLANGDSGSAAIDAVVQRWVALATPNPKPTRLGTAASPFTTAFAVLRWR